MKLRPVPDLGKLDAPPVIEREEDDPIAALDEYAWGGADLLSDTDLKPVWLIKNLAERGDVLLMSGQEKLGNKSWLALDMALAIATCTTWLGFAVQPQASRRVLYISAETDRSTIKRRMRMLACGRGVRLADAADRLRFVTEHPIALLPAELREERYRKAFLRARVDALKIHDEQRRSQMMRGAEQLAEAEVGGLGVGLRLLEAIEDIGPDGLSLVVIDTLRTALVGAENSSDDAKLFTQAARELARALRCVVLIVHHTIKAPGKGQRIARGSGELVAGPDALLTIEAGDPCEMSFSLRKHGNPADVGFRLCVAATTDEQEAANYDVPARLEVAPAGAASSKLDDEVLEVLAAHGDTGLTASTIRRQLASNRGGKSGAKVAPAPIKAALERLVAQKLASPCRITSPRGGRAFDGFRVGAEGGEVATRRIDGDEPFDSLFGGDPCDV